MTLTYSMLSTFNECPLKYKYIYIDKKPTKPKPYLSMGMSLHATLGKFFQLAPEARTLNTLENLLKANWERKGYGNNLQLERWYALKAQQLLRDFYGVCDKTAIPYYVEKTFVLKIDDGIKLTGKIDRIDKIEDGEYEVIDYKTSDYIMDEYQAKFDLQLSIYYIAARYSLGLNVTSLCLYYLKEGKKVRTTRTDEEGKRTVEQIRETAERISKLKIFYARPGKFCSFCDFSKICSAFQSDS